MAKQEEQRADKAAVEGILKSREAQSLAEVLRRLDDPGLKQAAESAAKGEGGALQAILSRVMADPEGARAVEALRKKTGG